MQPTHYYTVLFSASGSCVCDLGEAALPTSVMPLFECLAQYACRWQAVSPLERLNCTGSALCSPVTALPSFHYKFRFSQAIIVALAVASDRTIDA